MSFYSINAHASRLNEERPEYVGSEGRAFEGASWHAGKLTRGFNRRVNPAGLTQEYLY